MKKTHAQTWPKTLPKGWELNHLLRQAEEVGGDFCNARYREPYLYLLIGDVAGKGPTASLLAQQFHTAFDSATLVSSRAREVLHFMHELISEGLERADTFVTLAVVVMDTRDGSFTYASAGHTSTYWLHYEGPQAEFLEATGFPFGIPAPDQSYREIEGRLEPGDSIWLYTDGVTEVPDRYNHIFGRAGLLDVLLAVREASLDRQVAAVRRAVGLHHGTQSLPDDMAILAIRRTPEHPVLDALPFVIWARYLVDAFPGFLLPVGAGRFRSADQHRTTCLRGSTCPSPPGPGPDSRMPAGLSRRGGAGRLGCRRALQRRAGHSFVAS